MRQSFTPEDILIAADPRALRRRFGLPHQLSKFAVKDGVKDNICADAILEFKSERVGTEPGSPMRRPAMWFLFGSEQAFFIVCAEAGIDAQKLRSHLESCQRLATSWASYLRNAREETNDQHLRHRDRDRDSVGHKSGESSV